MEMGKEKVKNRETIFHIIFSIILCIFCAYGILSLHCIIPAIIIYAFAIALVWWNNNLDEKKNLIAAIVCFCITPFVCYFLLEYALQLWCAYPNLMDLCPKYHVANLGVYGGILLLAIFFSGSFRVSGVITYVVTITLAAAMYYITMFRGVMLFAADIMGFRTAMNVAEAYDYNLQPDQFIAFSIGILGIVLTLKIRYKLNLNWKRRVAMALAGLLLASGLFLIYFKWEKFNDIEIKLYAPHESYYEFGTAYGFLETFKYLTAEKPESYSVQAAEKIAERYKEAVQSQDNRKNEKPNIIMVMDESLCDLQNAGSVSFKTNRDVFPVIHSLHENTQKGRLHVHRFGGGTATMEFEALTGNTNAFLTYGTMAYQTIVKENTPSLAAQLKDQGYQGIIASHPHNKTGYSRYLAYPNMGFKDFKSIDDFDFKEGDYGISLYPSDSASFREIIKEYEAAKEKSNAPFFGFQVTMQNHTPYKVQENPEITVEKKFADWTELQYYLNYMHESDEATGELIDYFNKVDEPTLVVVFGDHPPRLGNNFFGTLSGNPDSYTKKELIEVWNTPLCIWANYDIEEKDLGDTSMNYISGYVIDAAGINKTGYQMFLEDFQEDVPIINEAGYIAKDGNLYAVDDKKSQYWEEVNEYRILEYNNLIDRGNRIQWFFN